MRLCVKLLAMTFGLTMVQSITANQPKANAPEVVKIETLFANPAAYEGKTIVVRATVAGAFIEGTNFCRLAVNGRSAALGAFVGVPDVVHFGVPKDDKEKLLKNWKADTSYTADLTITLQKPQGKDKHRMAVVSAISIKDSAVLIKDTAKTEVNGGLKDKDAPKPTDKSTADNTSKQSPRPAMIQAMSLHQLLEAYDPSEADNAIGKRLEKITKGEPCIVFDKDGRVIVKASEALVAELKDGFKSRQTYLVEGVPHKTYKVGESPNKLFAENPLYPGSALRSDGTCDRTDRTWESVPQSVRQVIFLAVTKTGEIKIEKPEDAHAIIDKVTGTAADAEKWVKSRYSKAYLLYTDLKARGELPSLKMTSVQRPATQEAKPAIAQPTGSPTAQPSRPSTTQPPTKPIEKSGD